MTFRFRALIGKYLISIKKIPTPTTPPAEEPEDTPSSPLEDKIKITIPDDDPFAPNRGTPKDKIKRPYITIPKDPSKDKTKKPYVKDPYEQDPFRPYTIPPESPFNKILNDFNNYNAPENPEIQVIYSK